MSLTHDDARRYSRQTMLPEIGEAGQQRLSESKVLVIGAGGLGAAVLSYLAAAGVGTLGIADGDHVELSNLNRQIIHEHGDIGRLKVESAADRISELNPDIRVDVYPRRITAENAASYIRNYDLVVDGCDNFQTRFVVHEACLQLKKPLVSAAVRGWSGQISTFKAYLGGAHPCYRCLVPDIPPQPNNCSETGVIGPLVGVMGSMQAVEAIKELLGAGESLSGQLVRYDALSGQFSKTLLKADPACPCCASLHKKIA